MYQPEPEGLPELGLSRTSQKRPERYLPLRAGLDHHQAQGEQSHPEECGLSSPIALLPPQGKVQMAVKSRWGDEQRARRGGISSDPFSSAGDSLKHAWTKLNSLEHSNSWTWTLGLNIITALDYSKVSRKVKWLARIGRGSNPYWIKYKGWGRQKIKVCFFRLAVMLTQHCRCMDVSSFGPHFSLRLSFPGVFRRNLPGQVNGVLGNKGLLLRKWVWSFNKIKTGFFITGLLRNFNMLIFSLDIQEVDSWHFLCSSHYTLFLLHAWRGFSEGTGKCCPITQNTMPIW